MRSSEYLHKKIDRDNLPNLVDSVRSLPQLLKRLPDGKHDDMLKLRESYNKIMHLLLKDEYKAIPDTLFKECDKFEALYKAVFARLKLLFHPDTSSLEVKQYLTQQEVTSDTMIAAISSIEIFFRARLTDLYVPPAPKTILPMPASGFTSASAGSASASAGSASASAGVPSAAWLTKPDYPCLSHAIELTYRVNLPEFNGEALKTFLESHTPCGVSIRVQRPGRIIISIYHIVVTDTMRAEMSLFKLKDAVQYFSAKIEHYLQDNSLYSAAPAPAPAPAPAFPWTGRTSEGSAAPASAARLFSTKARQRVDKRKRDDLTLKIFSDCSGGKQEDVSAIINELFSVVVESATITDGLITVVCTNKVQHNSMRDRYDKVVDSDKFKQRLKAVLGGAANDESLGYSESKEAAGSDSDESYGYDYGGDSDDNDSSGERSSPSL